MDATAEQTQAPEAPEQPKNDAQKAISELFRFSTWVHIGTGADECEARETGCTDPQHFHAWCRLPNQFQHQDIRERALAAKARRMRQLRDPNTDAYEVIEADMTELLRVEDSVLVDELLTKDWWKRHLEAMSEVDARDEYEHVERDRERLLELRELAEADRPGDEFAELERHLTTYGEVVEAEREKLEQPIRDALAGLGKQELVDQIREDRIAAEAGGAFMDSYSKWEWLAGTFTSPDPLLRRPTFTSLDELLAAAPEIIETLRTTYAELESSLQRGAQGN